MKLFGVEKYKENSYQWSSGYVPPEEKEKAWYAKQAAEAMYHDYVTDKTAISVDKASEFELLRRYGQGRQPTDYYKDAILGQKKDKPSQLENRELSDQKRKAWANVDFDKVISYAPKIKDQIHGMFDAQDMDVVADTIDSDSGMIKRDKKLEIETEMLFARELGELRDLVGDETPQMDFYPLDKAELEDYEASGGFKLNVAKAMEKLMKHTFSLSKYKQLKKMWLDDAIDIGLIGAQPTEDVDTGEEVVDYLNPSNLIMQWSKYPDFRDSEYCGHFDLKSISELAANGVSREELERISKHYSGKLGNPSIDYWHKYNIRNAGNTFGYDFYKVPVLKGYFIDFEDNYEKEYIDKYGNRRVINTRYGYEKKSNNEKVRNKRVRYLYKFNWVVDTDVVYDYGKEYNQERRNNKDVKLPFRLMQVSKTSVMERIMPALDDMMFSWVKYQNAQIMAANHGYAVNTRLLENVMMDNKPADPRELLKMMIETGYLFYTDGNPADGEGYKGGSVQPVQELHGGMRNQLDESIAKFRFAMEVIEQETGLPSLSPNASGKDVTATESQLSVSASQDIIRPIIDGIMDLKGEIAESVIYRIQHRLVREEDLRKRYSEVIGKKDLQSIIDAQGRGARMGVHFEAKPTREDLQDIYRQIEIAMTGGKNGQPLLEPDEGIMLKEQLMNGSNFKDIRFKLSYKIRRRKLEQQRAAQEAEQREFQRNMQYRQQDAQKDMQEKQMEAEKEFRLEQMKQQHERQMQNSKLNAEYEQLVMRLSGDEEKMENERMLKGGELQQREKEQTQQQ